MSYQNANRKSDVFRDIFYEAYRHFGQQGWGSRKGFRFRMPVYDWAHYTARKGAVKMHTLLDYDCLLPDFVNITDGKGSDNKAAFGIPVQPRSIVVANRGYCDYALLNHWDSRGVSFVVRHKGNIRYRCIRELPLPDRAAQDVLIDEEIELELPKAKEKYDGRLRRIAAWNDEHGYVVELLTNNLRLAASTIAALYKARWMTGIFFRNLKQLLRIKNFIGMSRNAVETQIWTAMLTMLLLVWLKHRARYKWAMANLVVSLRLNTFTKIDLEKWLNEPFTPPPDEEKCL